jgi:electron transfer flavoprotein beta subunit
MVTEMDIAVCVKQVPASNNVCVDPVTHALLRDSAESMLNPADANALEEALVLRERYGGRVVAFTMGPLSAEKELRTAVAMGADDAVLITDKLFAGSDTVATAKVLAEGIRRGGPFDLVLTGSESSDGATGQVGPMLAEYMSLPHVTDMQKIETIETDEETSSLIGSKRFGNDRARVRVSLPAVLTMSYGCNDPRLTTFASQIASKKKPVGRYTNSDLALPPETVGLEGSPTVVLDSYEPEKDKNAIFLVGSPDEIASKILSLIEEKGGASHE